MFFDGASTSPKGERKENPQNNGVWDRIVFIIQIMLLSHTPFPSPNDVQTTPVEYEAVITGLELALPIATNLTIYFDFNWSSNNCEGNILYEWWR